MNEEDKKKAAIAFGEQFAKAAIPIACAEIVHGAHDPLQDHALQLVIDAAFRAGELYTEALFKQAEKVGLTIQNQPQQVQGQIIQVPRTNNSN